MTRPETPYPRLFSPLDLAGQSLRNRIVHLATVTNFNDAGRITDRFIAYHAARAKGGAGMIVTEGLSVHPSSAPNPRVVALYDPANRDGLKRLAGAVEGAGCRLLGQLWHVGRQQLWGPQATPLGVSHLPDALSWQVPHVMDRSQIEALVAAFVACARLLQEAGFSGAELHGAHGYLITQFLSPWSNLRDDDYGGDRVRRMRFLGEVIAGIRAACGARFILGLKMPAEEGVAGGIDLAEARAITTALAADGGLDYIAYSQGNFSLSLERHLPDMHFPSAPYAALARALKPAAGAIKVMALARIASAGEAEALLADGAGELVGLGRPLIAEPAWPDKLARGDGAELRPCTYCNYCWSEVYAGRALACAQNVRLGGTQELAPWITTAPRRRRVAVVGAGPAGLEAAWLAASAGHEVTLFGASETPGGKVRIEALLPGRGEAMEVVRFQAERIARLGVEQRLGRAASADDIAAAAPEVAVLATGATMQPPPLAGGSAAMAALTDAVPGLVADAAPRAGTAVLFDHDQSPPVYAAAELLAARYARVVVVTPATQIARHVPYVSAIGVHRRLFAAGVEIVIGCRPVAWTDGRLVLENLFTGAETAIADVACALYATPRRANDALAAPLAEAGIALHLIGDAYAPRTLHAAMLEARRAAEKIGSS